jgi:hypothetical protein
MIAELSLDIAQTSRAHEVNAYDHSIEELATLACRLPAGACLKIRNSISMGSREMDQIASSTSATVLFV